MGRFYLSFPRGSSFLNRHRMPTRSCHCEFGRITTKPMRGTWEGQGIERRPRAGIQRCKTSYKSFRPSCLSNQLVSSSEALQSSPHQIDNGTPASPHHRQRPRPPSGQWLRRQAALQVQLATCGSHSRFQRCLQPRLWLFEVLEAQWSIVLRGRRRPG